MLLMIRMYEKLSSFQLLRTVPPYSGRFPKSSKVGAFLPRPPPFRVKKSPFPGIKKAGRERTLSG